MQTDTLTNTIRTALAGLGLCFLAACSSNMVQPQLYKKSPPVIAIVNHAELQDAGYMARYLMDVEERLALEARVRKQATKSPATSAAAGLTGKAMLGMNPLSARSVNSAGNRMNGMEAAAQLMDIFGPDGNLPMVSKLYLPAQLDGQQFATAQQATEFARAYTEQRTQAFAQQENRRFECISACGGSASVYQLTKTGFNGTEAYDAMRQGDAAQGEYYDPPALYVIIITSDMIAARADAVRDRILGYTPRWESRFENGWHSYLTGKLLTDEQGRIKTKQDDYLGGIPQKWYYTTENTPIARRFFRTLTGGDNLIYRGRDITFGRQFAFQGKVYAFRPARLANHFMHHEIAPKTDAIAAQVKPLTVSDMSKN